MAAASRVRAVVEVWRGMVASTSWQRQQCVAGQDRLAHAEHPSDRRSVPPDLVTVHHVVVYQREVVCELHCDRARHRVVCAAATISADSRASAGRIAYRPLHRLDDRARRASPGGTRHCAGVEDRACRPPRALPGQPSIAPCEHVAGWSWAVWSAVHSQASVSALAGSLGIQRRGRGCQFQSLLKHDRRQPAEEGGSTVQGMRGGLVLVWTGPGAQCPHGGVGAAADQVRIVVEEAVPGWHACSRCPSVSCSSASRARVIARERRSATGRCCIDVPSALDGVVAVAETCAGGGFLIRQGTSVVGRYTRDVSAGVEEMSLGADQCCQRLMPVAVRARVLSSTAIGDASVFVARTEFHVDDRLRALYAENADWNEVLRDLSEAAFGGIVRVRSMPSTSPSHASCSAWARRANKSSSISSRRGSIHAGKGFHMAACSRPAQPSRASGMRAANRSCTRLGRRETEPETRLTRFTQLS